MPSHRETITIELHKDDALRACRRVLPPLGWEENEAGPDRVFASEDATRLCCRESPSRVEIELSPRGADRTDVSFNLTAPGIGPIPGPARLKRQTAALITRIRAESQG